MVSIPIIPNVDGSIDISVVVPVYNEQDVLWELTNRISSACKKCSTNWEILFVNDGSTDCSLIDLLEISKNYHQVRIVNLTRNFGHMAALSAGLSLSKGRAVITIDADLQDPPELIPDMVSRWKEGAKVVIAIRNRKTDKTFIRLFTNIFYSILSIGSSSFIPKQVGTFSLIDRLVVTSMMGLPEKDRFFAGIRAYVGYGTAYINYDRGKRRSGKSGVGVLGLIKLAKSALIGFSNFPLKVITLLNFLFFFVVLSFGIYMAVTLKFNQSELDSIIIILGFAGLLISSWLYLLGEYLRVILTEVKRRPTYIIQDEYEKGTQISNKPKEEK